MDEERSADAASKKTGPLAKARLARLFTHLFDAQGFYFVFLLRRFG